MRYTREQITKLVERLLKRAGVSKPPVPVEQVSRLLGAEIRYVPFQGDISGMVANEDGQSVIGVNALHSTARQRFTIAHEIGHIELDHLPMRNDPSGVHVDRDFKVMLRDTNSSRATDPLEIEANAYAADLLMPRSMLVKEAELRAGFDIEDDKLIQGLAVKYKVSAQAMTFRLTNIANLLVARSKPLAPRRVVSRKK